MSLTVAVSIERERTRTRLRWARGYLVHLRACGHDILVRLQRWLCVYHLGAAQFVQSHVLPHAPPESVAFSGSSGRALVAAALCTWIDIEELVTIVISTPRASSTP